MPSRLLAFCLLALLAAGPPPAARAQADAADPTRVSTEPAKYWIFFTDKLDGGGKVATPAPGYVSPEALERRRRRGRTAPAHLDGPVSAAYLDRLRAEGIEPLVLSRWLNAASARLTPERARDLVRHPFVRSVRPVARLAAPPPAPSKRGDAASATEPARAIDFGRSRRQLAMINAIEPLETGIDGRGVRLGFLDTSFDGFSHPAFRRLVDEGRLLGVEDFAQGPQANTHGLSVASVAVGFDEGQLVGPAHGATVLAATTEYAPTETRVEEDNFVAGLEWLEAHGVDVVNVSLGYTTFDDPADSYSPADLDGDTAVTTRAVDRAAALGVVVVTSAGNEGRCASPSACWYYIGTPADADSVITVGAVAPDSSRATFSSHGPTADGRIKPDVAAPGTNVYLASAEGGYAYSSGTSFSSPLVAGVVCQMLQVNPDLDPIQVRDLLRETASRAREPDNDLGWGIIDAAAAVERALLLRLGEELPEAPELAAPYPNPFRDRATFEIRSPVGVAGARLEVYDALGRLVARPLQGRIGAGITRVVLDGQGLPAGVYLYRLLGEGVRQSGLLVHAP